MKRQISNNLLAPTVFHISLQDQNKLLELLTEFEELFDETLGDWTIDPMSFELKEGAKPYHGRSYPVPKAYMDATIRELNRLVTLGVVEFKPGLEWASPSFMIPKKMELYVLLQILGK
jgi:hypothetical protein